MVVARHGLPRLIISDRGSQFESAPMDWGDGGSQARAQRLPRPTIPKPMERLNGRTGLSFR